MNASFVRACGWLAWPLRLVYGGLIVRDALQGQGAQFAFGAIIFLVLLAVLWASRKDPRFHVLDACLLILFIAAALSPLAGVPLRSSILGPDKVFHTAGGALLAWFAGIWFTGQGAALRPKQVAVRMIAFAFLLGVAWEGYEWFFQMYLPMHLTLIDSVLDVVADTLGGCLAAWWLVRSR